jgi:hypothetical protein
VGHCFDLSSEVVGITLFTLACLIDVLTVRRTGVPDLGFLPLGAEYRGPAIQVERLSGGLETW